MIFNYVGGGSKAPTLKFSTPYGTAPDGQAATFDEPAAPTQAGYEFLGWFADAGLAKPFDWAGEAKAATAYAKWAIAAPTVSPAGPSTYDGTAKALGTVAAKGAGQTVSYSLDGSTWTPTAPTATDAGSYTVRWKVEADHCDALTGQFDVAIAKAAMSVSTTDKSATYSGNSVQANAVKVSTPASGYTVKYGKTAGTYDLATPPTYTTAGEYTVYYQVTADNYTTVAGTYRVTIAKASCALSISPTTLTVKEADGGTGTIAVTRTGSGAVAATSSNTSAATVSVSGTTVTVTYVGAGSATVTVKVAATTNYTSGSATCAVTTESSMPDNTPETWAGVTTKYAVSLYGVSVDKDAAGNTLGLTFGPATGANYVSTGKGHTPTGTTAKGNAKRCIHSDNWAVIAFWAESDPEVYEDCVANGCTKAIGNTLNSKLKGGTYAMSGDGASMLYQSIASSYRGWNSSSYNTGGWPASQVRAVLNGKDSLTGSYASYALDASQCLLSCFPPTLRDAIVAKAVRSDTVYSSQAAADCKTTYDKLWLLSGKEAYGNSGSNNSVIRANEGELYPRAGKLGITTSAYGKMVGYNESGSTDGWWLRSPYTGYGSSVFNVGTGGDWRGGSAGGSCGVAPGFCLGKVGVK